jgi:hypothetical protein
MFFRRFYDDGLAQASYLIGCDATGEAVVIDPNRDIAQYLSAAAAERLQITRVTETRAGATGSTGSLNATAQHCCTTAIRFMRGACDSTCCTHPATRRSTSCFS